MSPCIDCGDPANGRRCRDCYITGVSDTRPVLRCQWCGVPTTSKFRVCKGIEIAPEPTDRDALPPGRWVNVRGVMRWVDVEDEIAAYEAKAYEAKLADERAEVLARLVAERNLPPMWWSKRSAREHRLERRALAADYERVGRTA